MDNELLVKSIRELCKKNNIAISQLEGDLKFGAGLISRWTKNSPSLDKIVDIADYFHVSLDEVVGYKRSFSENQTLKFINSVYEQTKTNELVWYAFDKNHSVKFKNVYIFTEENYNGWEKEFYYSKYQNGYFLFEIFYLEINFEITDTVLRFYIQPDENSTPVLQCEGEDILGTLWKYIRPRFYGTLNEVKAEELKNQFILNTSKTNSKDITSKNTNLSDIQKVLSNPDIIRLMEVYNQPEFQELQKTFSNPEFQAAMQAANQLQHYFDQ